MTATELIHAAASRQELRPATVEYLAALDLADAFPVYVGGRGYVPTITLRTAKRETFVQWNHTGNYYRQQEVPA